jgi:hypothetical protein
MARHVASLYGYPVVVKGDRPGIGTQADFDALASRYTLDSVAQLCAVITSRRLFRREETDRVLTKVGIDPYTTFLPSLLRRVVIEAIRGRSLPDSATELLTDRALARLEDAANYVVPDADFSEKDSMDALYAMGLRLLQFQYSDQLGLTSYRRDVNFCLAVIKRCREKGVDLDAAFARKHGVTFADQVFVTFVIGALTVAASGRFIRDDLAQLPGLRDIDSSVLDRCITLLTGTYDDIQEAAKLPDVFINGYETYALSPTRKWPLLRGNDGHLRPPVARDLLMRPTWGFVIDARDALQGKQERGELDNALGEIYEEWVGRSFHAAGIDCERGTTVFPEQRKQCDWVSASETEVLLIEAKTALVGFTPLMTKERESLKAAWSRRGNLVDAVQQLDDSARAIRANETRFHRRSFLSGLLVVKGEQVGLNSSFARNLIAEILSERGCPEPIIRYEVVNESGLDALVRFAATGQSIHRFIRKRISDKSKLRFDDTDRNIEQLGIELPKHPLENEDASAFTELISTRRAPRR